MSGARTKKPVKASDGDFFCDACNAYIPFARFSMISEQGRNAKAYNWDQTRPVFVFSCGKLHCDSKCERICDQLRSDAGLNWEHAKFALPDKRYLQMVL